MVVVGKIISSENLLARKFTWFMFPNTSTPFNFVPRKINGVFRADYMTRISYIYSRLPITHSLTFWLSETVTHSSIYVTWVRIYSATFFFPDLPFRLDLFQFCARPPTFRLISKETNDQHGRKHVLLEYIAIFMCIDTSREILSQHTIIVYMTLLIIRISP